MQCGGPSSLRRELSPYNRIAQTHEGKTLRDLLHLAKKKKKKIISSIYANTRGTLNLRNELLFLSLNIDLTSFKRPSSWTLNLPAMED